MIVAGHEIPDTCPVDCPHAGSFTKHGQNAICGRCPILVCTPLPNEEDDFVLVPADDYRPDWAEAWAKWFAEGMEGYPILHL